MYKIDKYEENVQIYNIDIFMKLRKKNYRDVITINTNPWLRCHFAVVVKRQAKFSIFIRVIYIGYIVSSPQGLVRGKNYLSIVSILLSLEKGFGENAGKVNKAMKKAVINHLLPKRIHSRIAFHSTRKILKLVDQLHAT